MLRWEEERLNFLLVILMKTRSWNTSLRWILFTCRIEQSRIGASSHSGDFLPEELSFLPKLLTWILIKLGHDSTLQVQQIENYLRKTFPEQDATTKRKSFELDEPLYFETELSGYTEVFIGIKEDSNYTFNFVFRSNRERPDFVRTTGPTYIGIAHGFNIPIKIKSGSGCQWRSHSSSAPASFASISWKTTALSRRKSDTISELKMGSNMATLATSQESNCA